MESPPHKATQACGPFKKRKRKCDKLLPKCSLCVRISRACHYTDAPKPTPTAAEFAALQERLTELEDRLSRSSEHPGSLSAAVSVSGASSLATESSGTTWPSRGLASFPSALFLDIDCYKWSNMQLPRPAVSIPMEVLGVLNQPNAILETSALYFDTIHPWLPIVSKKRLDLGISLQNSGPDLPMLFLAMKLTTFSLPVENTGNNPLYLTAKGFLATLEASGVVSLVYLQAMVLIAIFEYGHSIYPAAWMTVGACVRFAELLGLSPGTDSMNVMSRVTTWTEAEERRRVWWAVYVLDRVISLGSRRRFSLPEPADVDFLPVDDKAWDSGDVMNITYYPVTTPFSAHASSFARLCQSAMFIGRASACRSSSQTALMHQIGAITSLTEDLCTFSSILADEMTSSTLDRYLRLLAPQCLTWSALFLLLDNYCCPEKFSDEPGYMPSAGTKGPDELATQTQAMLVVRNISDQAHEKTKEVMDIISSQPSIDHVGSISPFSLDALYCSMVTFQWIYRECGDEIAHVRLTAIEACMRRLSERWRLASEYLALGEVYRNVGNI